LPVFSSHLDDYSTFGVNTRLREERKRQKLTLRQVADKAGVSEAKLSQIENGKLIVDIAELRQLAFAMNVPLSVLLPRSEERHYFVHRGEFARHKALMMHEIDGLSPGPQEHHNSFTPVAEPFVGRHLEPWLAAIQSLADEKIHFVQHDYEEFMFVLDGEVEFVLKMRWEPPIHETLGPGDSLYFRSCLPHCLRSVTNRPAHSLHVMLSLGGIGSDDGRYSASGRGNYRRVVDESVVREIADKISLLRQSHGLTLTELAATVGVSARQLAQVERGERPANIDLLLSLARRFWRPIEYFYSTSLESRPYYFIQRARDLPGVQSRVRTASVQSPARSPVHVYRPLAARFPGRGMHPYYVQTVASPAELSQRHSHVGEEFVYVLDGALEFLCEDNGKAVSEILHAGDSVYFDSSLPHLFNSLARNPLGATQAEVIAVFFSPLGERHIFALENDGDDSEPPQG
jgi:transcriptional regulator with XRE-family HTH domain